MKYMITGITGFVGSHLAEHLLTLPDAEVHGTTRWRSNRENIAHLQDRIRLHEFDMRDATSVHALIAQLRPDRIYHLAAQSFVPTSWNAPAETLTTNIVGEVNLFEGLRREALKATRVLVAGSSEEYGQVEASELPIRETQPLRPLSPYAVSKVGQDLLGYQYFRSYGLSIVRTRAFNHTGPRRGEPFVTSNFCRQFALIKKGKAEPVLKVGNLDAVRDFTDVRDIVRAYHLALEKCETGEVYNICSGRGVTIREIPGMLRRIAGVEGTLEPDPARRRPSDVPVLVGNCDRFRAATGWAPRIPFEQTVRDLFEYWLARV